MISSLVPRSDYPNLEESTYLNQASLGLIGRPAVEAMHAFLDDIAQHGNRFMSDQDEVAYFESLRTHAAQFLSSDAGWIAIVGGASELLGQLPYLLEPESGSRVLAVSTDFPAVTRPWLRLAERGGCEICFVDDVPTDDLTDILIDALDERTSVLAVSQVQYATGSMLDIPRLREATHRVGASLIVDATQAAGAVSVDVSEWAAEVVVCSGYKWLGGHGGVAIAAVSPSLLVDNPPLPGWMGAPEPFGFDATSLLVATDARRFTQSTMSYVSMAGLTASLKQLLSLDAKRIEAHAETLASLLFDKLASSGWDPFRNLDDASASPHIISIAHETRNYEAATAMLRAQGIVCGTRGGRIRVSLAPYNDENDVQALVETLLSS
ncbi:MAG: aminotransferase class V-fold PLP-dependent enzyme [Acidobacteriota bacterium]|jgi:selenocysteine lyase/cysteine desulfurase|nr:aminotransferase class V-fold PLP-dependent enzyme [Acidobacteriota bacterium]